MYYIQREIKIYFNEIDKLTDSLTKILKINEKVNQEFLSNKIQFEKLKNICLAINQEEIMKDYGKGLAEWLNESKSYIVNDNIMKVIVFFGNNFIFEKDRNTLKHLIEINQILLNKIALFFNENEEFQIFSGMLEKLKKIL